jgi:hypothetical protein
MLVEKELKGRQSRSKRLFTPRPTSMDPSMTATPSDAPSLTQPLTLLAPSTSAIPPATMPCAPEMSKYAALQGEVAMLSSSTTSTCLQLDGEDIFVSFSMPNILLKDVEANACASAKTSMES